MDDEIRSLRSWDGTGKIYSEETVQMLQDEIAQLQARVTELVEQANAAYGPYQQKVNYLQNLVSMKNDALSSYAEFYGRAASFCGLPEDALPSGQTDAIILQRLAEHAEIARLRGMVEQLVENSGDLHQLTNEIARLREAQRWIPVGERMPEFELGTASKYVEVAYRIPGSPNYLRGDVQYWEKYGWVFKWENGKAETFDDYGYIVEFWKPPFPLPQPPQEA